MFGHAHAPTLPPTPYTANTEAVPPPGRHTPNPLLVPHDAPVHTLFDAQLVANTLAAVSRPCQHRSFKPWHCEFYEHWLYPVAHSSMSEHPWAPTM